MKNYSYEKCLETSYKVNWKIGDILNGAQFDKTKRWLPEKLSGALAVKCLTIEEKILLTHIEMGSYAHLFGYVEEFITPTMVGLAAEHSLTDRSAFTALTNFAAEEIKHMNFFNSIRKQIDKTVGFDLELIGGQKETTEYVLGKATGAVLLLIDCIEWFTQHHYLTAIKEDKSLDRLTKDIFKAHWVEESQHAKIDHLEAVRVFSIMTDTEKDHAVEDLIELVGAVDGLLIKQTGYDINNLEKYINRNINATERDEVYNEILKAKRYSFIECGISHPKFTELFTNVTTATQQQRVSQALAA